MKKHTKIILAVAAVAVVATASVGFAQQRGGYGMGYRGHMMGEGYGYGDPMMDGYQRGQGWGHMMEPGDGPGMRGFWQSLAPEKRDALITLRQEHFAATRPVMNELAAARAERETLLAGLNPDEKRLDALTVTIIKLETSLLREQTAFRVKVKALVGEDGFVPYGPMFGFGSGSGPGNCPAVGWNRR